MAESMIYLENIYKRKVRLKKIEEKYQEIVKTNKERMIELGRKPICLASFFMFYYVIINMR